MPSMVRGTGSGLLPPTRTLPSLIPLLLLLLAVSPASTLLFQRRAPLSTLTATPSGARGRRSFPSSSGPRAATRSSDDAIGEILSLVEAEATEDGEDSEERVASLYREIESSNRDGEGGDDPFGPLLGLYEVSNVQTVKRGENPVGGKWTRKGGLAQRLLRTRRTFQHLLPVNSTGLGRTSIPASFRGEVSPVEAGAPSSSPAAADRPIVAEAINVISLDALFGLVRLTVMLRGDAAALTPSEKARSEERLGRTLREAGRDGIEAARLSDRAVRAYFDPPRIVGGRTGRFFNINLGPTSDVVLDTTYCNGRVRIGRGGTSGTRFLFKREKEDDEEANEFRSLLARRPLRRRTALALLGCAVAVGGRTALTRGAGVAARTGGAIGAAMSVLAGAAVLLSAGGIERESYDS